MKLLISVVCAVVLLVAVSARAVITTSQKTVTGTATLLASSGANQTKSVLVINQDAAVSAFIGGSSAVTTSTGVELKHDASVTINLNQNDTLYGIVASGSIRVDVLESK